MILSPTIIILGVFLAAAIFSDLRWRKIPNRLVAIGLIAGLLARGFDEGSSGLYTALLGSLTGFGLLLPLYAIATLGAGDVKFMAAAGAYMQPNEVVWAVIVGIAFNGFIGLTIISLAGDLRRTFHRYGAMLATMIMLKKPHYMPPEAGEATARRMPYVIGLALATAWVAADLNLSLQPFFTKG